MLITRGFVFPTAMTMGRITVISSIGLATIVIINAMELFVVLDGGHCEWSRWSITSKGCSITMFTQARISWLHSSATTFALFPIRPQITRTT